MLFKNICHRVSRNELPIFFMMQGYIFISVGSIKDEWLVFFVSKTGNESQPQSTKKTDSILKNEFIFLTTF